MSDMDRIRPQRVLARLRTVASELSGYEVADLNEASTFLELGFDSLFLVQLATAFQHEYGFKITFRQLFDEIPTLRALADHIDLQLSAEAPVAHRGDLVSVGAPLRDVEPSSEPVTGSGSPPMSASGAAARYEAVQRVMALQLAVMTEQFQLLRLLKYQGAIVSAPIITPAATSIEVRSIRSVALAKEAADTLAVSQKISDVVVEPSSDQTTGSPLRRTIPLTAGQREIWIASQMGDVACCAFNESVSMLIEGPPDSGRFAQAPTKVLAEQESFGYRFDDEGESQWVGTQVSVDLPTIDLSELDEVSRAAQLDVLVDQEEPQTVSGPGADYLAAIWSELLGTAVSPDDNFFDLGGHSLLAVQMANRVAADTGVRIKLIELTTSDLAQIAAELPPPYGSKSAAAQSSQLEGSKIRLVYRRENNLMSDRQRGGRWLLANLE